MDHAIAGTRTVQALRAGRYLGSRPRGGCESAIRLVGLDTEGGFDTHRNDRLLR